MTDLPTSLPCSTATLRQPHPPHDWEPQPGMNPVHCPGRSGPAAADRPNLDDLEAAPDDGPWCCTGNMEDCALCTDPNPNYPWICPGHPRTAANEQIVGEATRPAEQPAAQPWTQLEARAFNAVLPALREAGEWLPLTARRKVARAVLAELQSELDGPADDESELTAEEARALADDLGLQLYRAQDTLAFVAECCTIAEREQRPITTADVREWLKGAQCGRQLAASGQPCSCGGRFPLTHLHADQHQPEEQP
ncbi:hypothetical protein ABZX63_33450 [Streptomyces tendae]|uniref:hypothetical protein n=1 Tax=Streptomyces tendae TaxID=1932 RepID=UPI0033B3DE54